MAEPTKAAILEALRRVMDPELGRDLVSLNMIRNVAVCDGRVRVEVALTTPACPKKETMRRDVEQAVRSVPGVREVEVEFSAPFRRAGESLSLPSVRYSVAVGAGKGGVGKSTVAVLTALGLRRAGARVGLLDADVYGPSVPTMVGARGLKPAVRGQMIEPLEAEGIRLMSMGFIVTPDQAMIWRGPMVHGVLKQFLEQVEWGELDYLIIDLPPGTGDVPLTLAQTLPMTGSVVVCTPQDVALSDALRAIRMYEKLNVPCLGIIENMSYYVCPACGHRDEIFSHGGAAAQARALGIPFLGEIPLNTVIRKCCDVGAAARVFREADETVRAALDKVVENLIEQVSTRGAAVDEGPTLRID